MSDRYHEPCKNQAHVCICMYVLYLYNDNLYVVYNDTVCSIKQKHTLPQMNLVHEPRKVTVETISK